MAEELHAPVASIRMVMGDTALTPFDMGTVGSQTTPRMWPQIRKAAAAAREMLLDLAAQKWSVDRAALTIADGKVYGGRRTRAGFGELTQRREAGRAPFRPALPLTPADGVEGRPGHRCPRSNGREMVTGAHKYAYDVKRPGMLYGKVLYPPQFGATLVSLDASAAEAMPGVKVVHDGDFVGGGRARPGYGREGAGRAQGGVEAGCRPRPTAATSIQYFKQTAQDGGREPRT